MYSYTRKHQHCKCGNHWNVFFAFYTLGTANLKAFVFIKTIFLDQWQIKYTPTPKPAVYNTTFGSCSCTHMSLRKGSRSIFSTLGVKVIIIKKTELIYFNKIYYFVHKILVNFLTFWHKSALSVLFCMLQHNNMSLQHKIFGQIYRQGLIRHITNNNIWNPIHKINYIWSSKRKSYAESPCSILRSNQFLK